MKQSHHHFFSKKQRLHFFLGKKTKQKSQEPKYTASPLSKKLNSPFIRIYFLVHAFTPPPFASVYRPKKSLQFI